MMADQQTEEITRNLKFIKERICDDLDTFVDGLLEKDILSMSIKYKLDSCKTSKDKADTVIRIIINKGPRAMGAFKCLLEENKNYEDVLKKMTGVEVKGCDSSEESDVFYRHLASIEGTPLSGEEEEALKGREEMPTLSLQAKTMYEDDCLEGKYSQLQNAYEGARNQVTAQREKLYKANQAKIEIEKKYEEVKNENKSLLEIEKKYEEVKNENKSLLEENKSLRGENKLLRDENKSLLNENDSLKGTVAELYIKVRNQDIIGAEKDKKIAEIQRNIQALKEKRKKDRDKQKQFEKEVKNDREKLSEIAIVVQNLTDKSNVPKSLKKSDNSGKRQFIASGLNSNNSYNANLNKIKSKGK